MMTTWGVRQIVRFNWPFYVSGMGVVAAAAALARRLPPDMTTRTLVGAGAAVAAFWIVASLTASWLVYDWSPLTRWDWIHDALGFRPRTWINVHAGFDPSTPSLRSLFPSSAGRVFDIFDPAEMTEPSIARARPASLTVAAERVDYRRLPASPGSIDAVFLLLAAHELRTDAARSALFRELARILSPGGRLLVAEHLRDAANFAAYGPGFLHFHSRRTWLRAFADASLRVEREFSMTPFVRIFVVKTGGAACS